MVLLDMDQQVKMRCDSTENNIKDLAEEKENCGGEEKGSPDECNGKEEQLEGEDGGFVGAKLVATALRTMDKAMLQLNLEKPKVCEEREIRFEYLLHISVYNGEVQGGGFVHQGHQRVKASRRVHLDFKVNS